MFFSRRARRKNRYLDLSPLRRTNRVNFRTNRALSVEPLESRELLAADTAMLVADIGTKESGMEPSHVTNVNGTVFFTAEDGVHGVELWKTDGTVDGTVLVKDIRPGLESSGLRGLSAVGNSLFFVANDGETGSELWKSDGTTMGTVLVKDLNPGIYGSFGHTTSFVDLNGVAFFEGYSPEKGDELWRSDGTEAGTVLVTDLNPGVADSNINGLTKVGNQLFFATYHGLEDQLWTSDGTEAGTISLATVQAWNLTNVEGMLFASSSFGLLKSDGTAERTVVVKNISAQELTNVDGTLYFTNNEGIWKSDGTESGTVLVSSGGATRLASVNETLFFGRNGGNGFGFELWKTDGSEAGTTLVKNINPDGGSSPLQLTAFNDALYFWADDGEHGEELWKSDGTETGTFIVKDVFAGSEGSRPRQGLFRPTVVGNSLFFVAMDERNSINLWKSDGTTAGTMMVANKSQRNDGSNLGALKNIGGTVFFSADDGNTGNELWTTDGTQSGTRLVKDINPGADGPSFSTLADFNGTAIFSAKDGIHGRELWQSDGTELGTTLIKDILPGTNSSDPSDIVIAGGEMYFTATDGVIGRELWKSDGTEAGTVMVKDIRPGADWANPRNLTAVGNLLFFSASDGLWKSDGTTDGTVLVKTFSTNPERLTAVNGELFFVANDGVIGAELWKSDGTEQGTVLIEDIRPGSLGSRPQYLTQVGNELFFFANDGATGLELWKSNGTTAGTKLVRDIFPGTDSSAPEDDHFPQDAVIIDFNGTALFMANDGTTGFELWRSNGTTNQTELVRDININNTGQNGSWPYFGESIDGIHYFNASDNTNGREIWLTDGSSEGTMRLTELAPGTPALSGTSFTELDNEILFRGYEIQRGIELWKLVDSSDPALHPDPVVVPAGPGTILVEQLAGDLVVSKNSAEIYRAPLGSILDLTLQGDAASETFTINIDGLSDVQLPGGLIIDAGAGTGDVDTLELIGSKTINNYDYTTGGPESGTITLDGFTVTFSEFEPIVDRLNVTERTFSIGTPGGQTIVLGASAPGFSTIDDGGTGAFESLTFTTPLGTNILTISAGDGDDTLIVEPLDPQFGALLTLAGEEGDDTIDASLSDKPVVISGGSGGDTLLGGSANDTLIGGDGNDTMDGGEGTDRFDGGTGANDVVGDADDGVVTATQQRSLELSATFVDPVSATFDWGDGSPAEPGVVNTLAGLVVGSHSYEAAGIYTVTMTAVDSTGAETMKTVAVTVEPWMQLVEIDVKPSAGTDSTNVASNGSIAVAILGTHDFDVSQIDLLSLVFAGATAYKSDFTDIDQDGNLDLVLHYRTEETILDEVYAQLLLDDANADGVLDSTRQEIEVELTGTTLHNTLLKGSDAMNLFLSGKDLRELLEELALTGAI